MEVKNLQTQMAPFFSSPTCDSIRVLEAHTTREIEKVERRFEASLLRRQGQPEPPTVRLKLD
jgi:hypothetical protein